MSPLFIKISKDFATIWTTIDPIGNVAIFAGLTAALTRAERHRTALRAVLYATVILVVAVFAGQIILDAIGIRMHSLKVAGGIILFLFALKMLFGGLDRPGSPEAGRDLAVFPLAVPAIAGPGAMMAVIVLTDNDVYTVPEQAETGVVLVVVLLMTYIFLRFSDFILRVIGQQGAAVLVRVMGIILASLAVEIVLTALAVGSWGWRADKAAQITWNSEPAKIDDVERELALMTLGLAQRFLPAVSDLFSWNN
ncbi:MAG: MarC family protein [Verrucomicrobia bacterium]|nr:MAG: MarC family protein [Verrucomicrobiota bacterium]